MMFSVVTPSLNNRDGLRRCMASVRDQVGRGIEVEHLVQDACSSDGSVPFLEQYAAALADRPVTGYRFAYSSEPDGGMYDAIERGWARAGGAVLSWLNTDEQYLAGAFDTVRSTLGEDGSADMVFGDAIVVGPEGEPLAARREIPMRAFYLRNGFLYALSCCTFFRRRLRDRGVLAMDPSYRFAGDHELMARLLGSGAHVRHVRRYLALFGVHGANLSVRQAEAMGEETRSIRSRYGALPPAGRWIARLLRCTEKAVTGCYGAKSVSYRCYAGHGATVRHVPPTRVGCRFTYRSAAKRIGAASGRQGGHDRA